MKKFNMNNIEGQDASIEESLFQYGLAWILSEDKTEYKIYYGIHIDNNGYYDRFDFTFISADLDVYNEYDWIDDWSGIYSFTGLSGVEFKELPLMDKISTLVGYYGYQNIFGTSYDYGFKYNININRFQAVYSLEEL